MVLFKFVGRSLGLISTVILARLLMPSDFGVVAMAMVVIGILELITWFSFDVVLIQKQDTTREHYDTAWTFNFMFGVVSGLLVLALAHPTAAYFNEPRLVAVMYVLASAQFVGGLQNIGIVNFRKDMNFDREFFYFLGRKLGGFLITVPLAFILRNYWALVIGQVTSALAGVVLSYTMHPYRPRFSLSKSGELFDFSKWMLLLNVIVALRRRVAHLAVGKLAGAGPLGLFTVSYEISNLPTTELVAPINRAVFPGYAQMSHDLQILRDGYLKVLGVIALFALPAATGVAAIADLLVPVFLGEKWLDAIPLIQILAFYGGITALQTNAGPVYLALALPARLVWLQLIHLTILVPLAVWGTMSGGVVGAAWAFLAAHAIWTPLNLGVLLRTLKLKITEFVPIVARAAVGSIVMYFIVRWFTGSVSFGPSLAAGATELATAVLVGVGTYGFCVYLLWTAAGKPEGAEHYFLERIWPEIRNRLRASAS